MSDQGVSVPFFTESVATLTEHHGSRQGSANQLEKLREALAQAEAVWIKIRPEGVAELPEKES